LVMLVLFLIKKTTLRRVAGVALVAGIMAISGQPQVILYSFLAVFIIALAYTWHIRRQINFYKLVLGLCLSAVLAFGLAAINILPLMEFLPLTDRAAGLSPTELLEFSYYPSHAATLIFPNIFGDYESYRGAKSFQELSAYVGLLPIILSCLALCRWTNHKWLRANGLILCGLGMVFALGRFSPVYLYLIQFNWLSFLAVPGRFVFFIDVGIAILSACALNDLGHLMDRKWKYRETAWLVAGSAPLLLLIPFAVLAAKNDYVLNNLLVMPADFDASLLMFALGAGVFIWLWLFGHQNEVAARRVVLAVIALTLVVLGWNINPVISRETVRAEAAFSDTLANEVGSSGPPPRLYARKQLIIDSIQNRLLNTKEITPTFSIFQPVQVINQEVLCFDVEGSGIMGQPGEIDIGIHYAIGEPALQVIALTTDDFIRSEEQLLCFNGIEKQKDGQYVLSFKSSSRSGVVLKVERLAEHEKSAYLVRTDDLSTAVIMSSQKSLRVMVREANMTDKAAENLLRPRHLQAVDGYSGGRWLGALAINDYRQFVTFFFSNDAHPFDSENRHVLESYRKIADLAGITHLMQVITPGDIDLMEQNGFVLIEEQVRGDNSFRLYRNPQAFPKVFMVEKAEYDDVDESVLVKMSRQEFQPDKKVYIGGPRPPAEDELHGGAGVAELVEYENELVVVNVQSDEGGWLVVNDSTTPNWQAFVDGVRTPHYVADTVFKTARVPAGSHTVEFKYFSPATQRAKFMAKMSLVIILILLAIPYRRLAKARF